MTTSDRQPPAPEAPQPPEAPQAPEVGDAASRQLAAAAATIPMGGGLREHARTYLQRLRGGEIGALPATSGLVVLVIIFWVLHPSFGSLGNFAALLDQSASTICLAMGLVFVLLLGEIDLAAGTAAGACAAVMARLSAGYNAPWPVAILAAMVTGLVIGVLTGWLCAKVRIPSFVVTLALFLAFQGLTLIVVNNFQGTQGNISIDDSFITGLVNGQLSAWLGWLVVALVVVGYALVKLTGVRARVRAQLPAEPMTLVGLKVLALAVISVVAVYLLNQDRALNAGQVQLENVNGHLVQVKVAALLGVPWVVPIVLVLFTGWTFLLGKTRYGRHVYAVGGNREAARRAGIAVDRIRISVFVINSFMAAIAGILLASNVRAVDANTGGGNTLLLAVGAAVIGGTSLFGGKGKPLDAIIGGLVVAVIANGMSDLVQGINSSAVQFLITGAVLLLAAAVDALSRRRAGATGLG
ncbi:MAG: ABC transporter permease [Actinomycetota bacterium]|nr:ABC transporter permease [Actinomycetota bacterium]